MKKLNLSSYIQKHRRYDVLMLLVGAALTLAFAPFDIWPLALFCPALLFLFWSVVNSKRAFLQGLLFGLGFFGTSISWVYVSLHTYGNMSIFLAVIATFAFVFGMALVIGINGWYVNLLFKRLSYLRVFLIYPVSWVLFEWLRGTLFSGFPWVFLGYSQMMSPLSGFAPISSVFAVSFACVLISACLIGLLYENRIKIISFVGIVLIFGVGFYFKNINWTHIKGKPIKVSIIQGNIPQQLKWDPKYVIQTLQIYNQLTNQQLTNNDLIIWPENAIPVFEQQIKPYLHDLNSRLMKHHVGLITGMLILGASDDIYYNGAIGLGLAKGEYRKHHLVPFGEYLPLENMLGHLLKILDVPMSNFSAGPLIQPLFTFQHIKVALFICYETAYPLQIREALQQANLLVSLTNDTWFGASLGPKQHAQMNQMRALEAGRYMLNATNNGITDIISPKGQVLKVYPQNRRGVLAGKFYAVTGLTPWLIIGPYPLLGLFLLLLIIALIIEYGKKNN